MKETEKSGNKRAVDIAAQVTGQQKLQNLETAALIVKLIRLGYLKESGFLRRFIKVPPKGMEIIKKQFRLFPNASLPLTGGRLQSRIGDLLGDALW